MKWSITDVDHENIFLSIHTALYWALFRRYTSEPQLVANLVWEIPRAVNSISLTGAWSIKSAGVFVHAQPFVKCNSFPDPRKNSVEIGDLLFLRTEVCRGHAVSRRAMLLQAKMVPCLPVTPDNINQHYLYAKWPAFEYVRSTRALNGKKRHVTGFDLYDACRFLLISNHAPWCSRCLQHWRVCTKQCCCTSTASPTLPELSHYRCFAEELVEFILGDSGKPFVIPSPKRTRNWDRVVDDLIDVTALRRSVLMGRAAGTATRGQGQLFTFMSGDRPHASGLVQGLLGRSSQEEIIIDGPPEVPEIWPDENDDSGGISIVEFVVSTDDEK